MSSINNITVDEWNEVGRNYWYKPADPNVERVVESYLDRADDGMNKYGVTTSDNPLSLPEWLRHLQEELMDSTVYIERTLEELNKYQVFDNIVQWHHDRDLIKGSSDYAQLVKLTEETAELINDINVGVPPIDSIGDIMVVLANIAARHDLTLLDCATHAYNEIKNRKGKMVNGVFVKESPQGGQYEK